MKKQTNKFIPLNTNTFLLNGPSHKNGGIDVGNNIEAEGGEILKIEDNVMKILSKHKLGKGESPAKNYINGMSFDKAFALQENYKDKHNLNDDGTKQKAELGIAKFIKSLFGKNKNDKEINKEIDFNNLITTNNRKYNSNNIKYIYNKLNESNLNDLQKIAILSNIIEESGGNESAISKNKKYKGLIQWGDDRYSLINRNNENSELDNQINYIIESANNTNDRVSWTDGGKGTGYKSFRDAYKNFNEGTTIEDVMRGYTLGHVRPIGKNYSYMNRLKVAKQLEERFNEFNKKRNGGVGIPSTGNKIKADLGTTAMWTNIAGNALSSIINGAIYSSAINNLKKLPYESQPVEKDAIKLKTSININPQLEQIRNNVAEYEKDLNYNTASSAVRQNRIQQMRMKGTQMSNQLYSEKENKETELINADRMNRQTVQGENIKAYTDWRNRISQQQLTRMGLENQYLGQIGDSINSSISGIGSAIVNKVQYNEQKAQNNANIMIAALPYLDKLPLTDEEKKDPDKVREAVYNYAGIKLKCGGKKKIRRI